MTLTMKKTLSKLSLPVALAMCVSFAQAQDDLIRFLTSKKSESMSDKPEDIEAAKKTQALLADVDPFLVVNYGATLDKLSSSEQDVARVLQSNIQTLQKTVRQQEKNITTQEFDREEIVRDDGVVESLIGSFEDADKQLDNAFDELGRLLNESGVEVVQIDLLERMSPSKQLAALKCWLDIQRLSFSAYNQSTDTFDPIEGMELSKKYSELEGMLETVTFF